MSEFFDEKLALPVSELRVLMAKFPLESSFGGGERHTVQVAEYLKRIGAQVWLTTSDEVLAEEFERRKWSVKRALGKIEPVSRTSLLLFLLVWPVFAIYYAGLVWRMKRAHEVNVLYCLSLTGKLLMTVPALLLGMHVVWMEHVNIGEWLTKSPLKWPYVWLSRWVRVVAVSHSVEKDLVELGVPGAQVAVNYHGVDAEKFSSSGQALVKGVDFAKLKDRLVVGTVARLHKEKGLDVFLDAAKVVLGEQPRALFFVVGDGDEYPVLYAQAKRLGIEDSVLFFGRRKEADVLAFLELMDVFVLPSVGRESFGISVAEAMSMEVPVVASRVGGVGELVLDGETGVLFEPGNHLELASIVIDLLGDAGARERLGEAARRRVKAHFELEGALGALVDVLRWEARERVANVAIVQFPYESSFGGGEQHTLQLAEGVMARGGEVRLISSCKVLLEEFGKRGWWVRGVRFAGKEPVTKLTAVLFPFQAPVFLVRVGWELWKARFLGGVRVMYAMSLNEKMLLTPVARLMGVRVVWIEHLLIERWLLQNPWRFLYTGWSRFAEVVGVSEAVRLQLITIGVPEEHSHVIYNGIDPREFADVRAVDEVAEVSAKEIEGDEYYPVVATMSRLAVEKGVNYVIEAFAEVVRKMPRALLLVIGDGAEREALEELAEKLGVSERVKFLGFMGHGEAFGVLALADMFVMAPVRRESFGISLAEAMMLEKPVVATNIGGVAEVVSDHDTGYVVRAKDVEGLRDSMERLAASHEDAVEMGRRGRERVLEMFTVERMVDEFVGLFEGAEE